MPLQHGFEFTIRGKVFVPRKSSAGDHVVEALEEADDIRAKVQTMLLDLPVDFQCTMPRARARKAPDTGAEPGGIYPRNARG